MSKISFVATGDSFITRRLPSKNSASFKRLSELINQSDFRFTNLETTIHNHEGYPAAYSGGTWAMSSPDVLKDIKSYGFNIVAWANNHTLDYSYGGLFATKRYLDQANLIHSGVGKDLAEASSPKYLDTPNGRVALISATSTFHESGRAGDQRPDMIGRPGVNPLRYTTTNFVSEEEMEKLKSIAKKIGINASFNVSVKEGFILKPEEGLFHFGNSVFKVGKESKSVTEPHKHDMTRIKEKIFEAKRQSDAVIMSIHAHEMVGEDKAVPANFIEEAARKFIDAGADAVIGHGPHVLRGIEIYKGKPIFYSLGNFIFQNDSVSVLPADFYEKFELDHYANISDALDKRSFNDTKGFSQDKTFWESVIVDWTMESGELTNINLHPIELGHGLARHQRGWPTLSKQESILEELQKLSEPYGTNIEISDGIGTIKF